MRFSGQTRRFISKAANGRDAVRNFCPICSSLVFGAEVGKSEPFTIYAGSLDDPLSFYPKSQSWRGTVLTALVSRAVDLSGFRCAFISMASKWTTP